jgi:hypothetical protein
MGVKNPIVTPMKIHKYGGYIRLYQTYGGCFTMVIAIEVTSTPKYQMLAGPRTARPRLCRIRRERPDSEWQLDGDQPRINI